MGFDGKRWGAIRGKQYETDFKICVYKHASLSVCMHAYAYVYMQVTPSVCMCVRKHASL